MKSTICPMLQHQRFVKRLLTTATDSKIGRSNGSSGTNSSNVTIKTLFALQYTYVSDVLIKRVALRPLHLQYANDAVAAGALLAGGAFNPPAEGGLLLFSSTREKVEDFAKKDPYVTGGLVVKYKIQEWSVVVGSLMKSLS